MLVELATLKDYLGFSGVTSEDTPLNICLRTADGFMRNYCNRNFEETTYNTPLTPVDICTILVPEIPLTAIVGMTAFQHISDLVGQPVSLEYVKFFRSGKIYSSEGFFCPFMNSVQVIYTAGFTEEDSEWNTLQWLQLEIASELYRGRGLLNMATFQSGGAQWQRMSNTETTQSGEITSMLSPEIVLMLNMFSIRGPRIDY
jgi:hypothetical protein